MKISVLPGDGIGPEVTKAAVRVLTEVGETAGISIETTENLIGGTAIREQVRCFRRDRCGMSAKSSCPVGCGRRTGL